MLSIKGVRDENKNSLNKWIDIRDSDDNDECFSISEWNFSCLHKPSYPGQFGGGSDQHSSAYGSGVQAVFAALGWAGSRSIVARDSRCQPSAVFVNKMGSRRGYLDVGLITRRTSTSYSWLCRGLLYFFRPQNLFYQRAIRSQAHNMKRKGKQIENEHGSEGW